MKIKLVRYSRGLRLRIGRARGFVIVMATIALTSCQSSEKLTATDMVGGGSLAEALVTRTYCGPVPLVVGHRGAPGYTPEHTLNSYKLAIEQGADYIEPDLVMTKDGYLIARHENEISGTTNAAEKFPKRKKTKTIDGEEITGWFAEDFTLAEIKSLRARERLASRSQKENGLYEIPSFEEVLAFVKLEEKRWGRKIGVAPEIKHSTYHHSIGFKNIEKETVRLLNKYDYKKPGSMAMIQSFEIQNLKTLRQLTSLPLVQLLDDKEKSPADQPSVTYAQMATADGLKRIREYADWVSPHKSYIFEPGATLAQSRLTSFVTQAKAVGLKVIVYTFRSDKDQLPAVYLGDPAREYRLFYNQGVDGVFSDFPAHGVAVRQEFSTPCR
jgi:glycerophosphoryl diester phosphodiesterase